MALSRMNTEQRRALQLLAGSRYGVINENVLVHGHVISRRVLAELVRAGFAVAEHEVMAGNGAVEVVQVRITAMGKKALAVDQRAHRAAGAVGVGVRACRSRYPD